LVLFCRYFFPLAYTPLDPMQDPNKGAAKEEAPAADLPSDDPEGKTERQEVVHGSAPPALVIPVP
jgi:hypothetical protein